MSNFGELKKMWEDQGKKKPDNDHLPVPKIKPLPQKSTSQQETKKPGEVSKEDSRQTVSEIKGGLQGRLKMAGQPMLGMPMGMPMGSQNPYKSVSVPVRDEGQPHAQGVVEHSDAPNYRQSKQNIEMMFERRKQQEEQWKKDQQRKQHQKQEGGDGHEHHNQEQEVNENGEITISKIMRNVKGETKEQPNKKEEQHEKKDPELNADDMRTRGQKKERKTHADFDDF